MNQFCYIGNPDSLFPLGIWPDFLVFSRILSKNSLELFLDFPGFTRILYDAKICYVVFGFFGIFLDCSGFTRIFSISNYFWFFRFLRCF